ncbi:MAG: UDP-N-acetylmuramate dehydrogenase [Polyangiaceae bacterium]
MKPQATPRFEIEEDVPLAPRTTLGVGGPARYFAAARSEEDIREALRFAVDHALSVKTLGGGSNLLVADRGVDAVVLSVRIHGVRFDASGAVTVGAGEPWDPFVERMVNANLGGLECLSGIPGDAGSTPIQNVGAYGVEVADTLESVSAIDRQTLEDVEIPAADCAFAYRDSAFKRAWDGRYVITRVTFRLTENAPPKIRYAELTRALAENPKPTLAEVRHAVIALRRSKSMVLDLEDENHRSAGSFFTNPIVDDATLSRAREAATSVLREGESMPEFAAGPGRTKLAAGWLIERAGFRKGTSDGKVGLSTKHALAVVNKGGATAADIVAFAAKVKRGVFARFGVHLMPEPVLWGFEPHETAELLADASRTATHD